jgi:NAD(P) transhydrogenase
MKCYDLIVLGSGPGGQRAAVQAAKLGKSCLLIEKDEFGGACLHTATIPSKTIKEALAQLCQTEGVLPVDFMEPLMQRKSAVIAAEMEVVKSQLLRNKVECVQGLGRFAGTHEIEVLKKDGSSFRVRAEKIILATGTRPRRPADMHFDEEHLVDSDSVLNLRRKPESVCVVGAGVVGCEYASIFAHLGIPVTVIDTRQELLKGVDREVVAQLQKKLESMNVRFLLGQEFENPKLVGDRVHIKRGSQQLNFDLTLYCMGRVGNVESLDLDKVGLRTTSRGNIEVNKYFQTTVPHVYAVGDLIGSPALAAAAFEQGRLAALHAFGFESPGFPELFPYGIYTIPEISSVGFEEIDLQKKGIPYVTGRARFSELARGKILGDQEGLLKLLFHKETAKLLGVHIIGTQATELVHIGQVALSFEADLHHLLRLVFNYPTLAEAYKVACLHAANQLRHLPASPIV